MIINSSNGLYNFRRDLIIQLIKDGHEVVAFTPFIGRENQLAKIGVRLVETTIDRRGLNPIKDISLIRLYKRLLKEERPDIVMTYTIKPNVYGGICCQALHIPYAGNITGLGTAFESKGILKTIAILLNRIALKNAKCVFFENASNRKLFIDYGVVKEKQTVLLNGAGVNLDHFSLLPYPEKPFPVRFLFMGRVMREKGINELFAAISRLIAEGFDCKLDVLGLMEESYEHIIRQYEEDGWLYYHGVQEDVRPFIKTAHCFVLPSYHEGMANTNLESAASGRPIITSNIPGCKEAVIDGTSGILCEPQNEDDLYEKLKTFINMSMAEKKEMGIQGRKLMESRFDKKEVVSKTITNLLGR